MLRRWKWRGGVDGRCNVAVGRHVGNDRRLEDSYRLPNTEAAELARRVQFVSLGPAASQQSLGFFDCENGIFERRGLRDKRHSVSYGGCVILVVGRGGLSGHTLAFMP